MNKLMAGLCCLMLATSPFALAQDKAKADEKKAAKAVEKAADKAPTEAQKKQQERMRSCNDQAGGKKLEGEARKKFMSSCLKGESGEPQKAATQQDRMKDCNKQAGDKALKGDERKKFMSSCLKG